MVNTDIDNFCDVVNFERIIDFLSDQASKSGFTSVSFIVLGDEVWKMWKTVVAIKIVFILCH